jgi:3-oxoacyl-[acyl-carrier-protein] synthase III
MTLPTSGLITVNDRGARAATTFGSVAAGGGNMVFIKKLTASSSSTLSFVDGASSVVLDSTYKEYVFTFKDIHPSANASFNFNMSADGGSNYNVAKTTTMFNAFHNEADDNNNLGYRTGQDEAQSTGIAQITDEINTDNDVCMAGTFHLFNPASTTFVKHYMATTQHYHNNAFSMNAFSAGYGNTTSAVDAIQFSMSSGNIDAGDICLYGIL